MVDRDQIGYDRGSTMVKLSVTVVDHGQVTRPCFCHVCIIANC